MQAKKKGILTPETAHNGRQCLEYPHLETYNHPSTGRHPSDVTTLGVEAGNGQSKTKTLAASAAACTRKKRLINCTTKKDGVTPVSGTSENPGAIYTSAQYLEVEEQ